MTQCALVDIAETRTQPWWRFADVRRAYELRDKIEHNSAGTAKRHVHSLVRQSVFPLRGTVQRVFGFRLPKQNSLRANLKGCCFLLTGCGYVSPVH